MRQCLTVELRSGRVAVIREVSCCGSGAGECYLGKHGSTIVKTYLRSECFSTEIFSLCPSLSPSYAAEQTRFMAKLFDPPRYIALEGPIRVGKSTLSGIIADRLHAQRITEPENNPFLSAFYDGEPGAAFEAQFAFLISRFEQLRVLEPHSRKAVVCDYIFEKDKLFACINLNDTELAIYNRYYNYFREQLPTPDLVIYLQA